eukprot:2418521-Pyramimonas_sp.AAC.1
MVRSEFFPLNWRVHGPRPRPSPARQCLSDGASQAGATCFGRRRSAAALGWQVARAQPPASRAAHSD